MGKFVVKVGPSINKGIFAVIPETGVSGTTEFTLKVANWNFLGLENEITFDISFYRETSWYQSQLAKTLYQKRFFWQILNNQKTQQDFKVRLPIVPFNGNYILEINVNTPYETVSRKITVNLKS